MDSSMKRKTAAVNPPTTQAVEWLTLRGGFATLSREYNRKMVDVGTHPHSWCFGGFADVSIDLIALGLRLVAFV